MRIFHGTVEIAGQMGILSGALKRRGYVATGYNTFHSYLGYQDHLINTIGEELQACHEHLINFYDVFHFHYASSILPDFADLPLIRAKGKKMIMHHWGNDVRFHDQARVNNPYVYTGDSPPNEVIDERLKKISAYIDEAIVQDEEVLPYVQPYYRKVHVLPIAIDLRSFEPSYPKVNKKKPLLLHAPTNPDFKGTVYIERALAQLKQHYDFEYRRIEKMRHDDVIALYRHADLIIDQILCGSYGLLSVESMALGKPVITFIRPDLRKSFPDDLPIVSAHPDNIKEKIESLLLDPQKRKDLGEQGRRYAEKYHASDKLVDKLLSIYQA